MHRRIAGGSAELGAHLLVAAYGALMYSADD